MMQPDDQRWMALALSLGARGLGQTWPNPAVGCVIVKDGRVLARGWTQSGGRPHAERHALSQLPDGAARGATAYVTLEPCSHTGQTSPCASALINAGLARVVVATGDPDPRVSGRGIAMLLDAGLEVVTGVLDQQARQDQQGFLQRVTTGRPMVTLKLASSFDGRIATETGESQWITGPAARQQVQALRASHDAVMVGGSTAREDLPSLTLRAMGQRRQPVRVVVSAALNIPTHGPLAEDDSAAPVWLIHGSDAAPAARDFWRARGATLIEVGQGRAGLDMSEAVLALGQAGLTRVLCEGGGSLAASLLEADVVDQVVGFTAGVMLGATGLPSLGPLDYSGLEAAPRFSLRSNRRVGEDTMHIWQRVAD
ncbi:bifunctional diaminohydroxyphosphoribosylaminopyrimidine deaminase/5-amino-6-(5-phosphoribosylamino)uracil reductase RibD [uncultured Litoreibacter sp.]|uniref:bifunctional diaminohydroxyphosphoribosylaminopyrimidine deaminase/5-amino-6-(5-phosphoribosylamino)uracil reductase RibD n=1 Tax=uncultured Litoreibacter sp. TaxID=1392394 RepID=UPI0026350D57|nr:bifunctional diaminohydroxyphosphoribosylaminopyrimidine deaminase/5-amino-6-(5-phosphoribosylamino)uracil reductase RibD [uncultured Litoreibacter sp.]